MNLCNISSYLLIYVILWHGKRIGLIVNAQAESTASETEDETPKSGISSRTGVNDDQQSIVLSGVASSLSSAEELELINLDVNVKRNTDKYTYTLKDGVHRFIAGDNCWFNAATKRGVTFWNAADETQYGKKVVIRKVGGESRFRVYFSGDTPETEDELPTPPSKVKEEPKLLESKTENLIVLDVKMKETTDDYTYDYDAVEDVHTFTAIPPNLFGVVYKGKAVAWETEDGRYPNVALILKNEAGESYLRVFFPEAPVVPVVPKKKEEVVEEVEEVPEEVSEEEEEEERPALAGLVVEDMRKLLLERMPIVLNLKSKETNSQYTFSKEDDIGTYTANESFGFSSVVRNEERIWTQSNKSQLAVKVFFDGLGLLSSVNNVTIELIDGTFRHFTRSLNTWSVKGNKIRLDVSRRSTTLHYEYLEHHDIGTYTARFDCLFKDVILGPYCCRSFCSDSVTEIWNARREEGSKKVVIYLDLCTNRANFVSVHLSKNKINHYQKRGGFWTQTEPLIELDIDKKDSCYQFYYSGYDEIRSYCANYNFVFTRVCQGTSEIWRAHKKRYATMVMMNGDGIAIPATKLAIVLKSGKKLYYNRDGGAWVKGEGFPPFELDLDDTFSTDYVEYEEDTEKKTASYTAKHGFLMRSVVQDGIIWFTDNPKDYGVKVLTANDKNEVTVFSQSGKVRQFSRPEAGQLWSEVKPKLPVEKKKKGEPIVEVKKPKGLVLDVTSAKSTDKYSFLRKGETEIYKATKPAKFKVIQVGASPSEKDKIFFAKDIDEFVTKVEIDRSDDPGYINDVLLYLEDGTKKQFIKMSKNKRWCEVVAV